MFQYLVIVVLGGFVGILLFDFFTKKKTEVDGAHVVVSLLNFPPWPFDALKRK